MKTPYYSWKKGKLAKGCQQCVKGEKLVLFVTGICCRKCYYCPISDKKYQHDVIYANERPVNRSSDIVDEAKLCSAKGAGITGGDPLCKLDRTVKYIKMLKRKFGKKFHIHLYTSFDLVNEKNISKLYKAGLDEIRFHADIENDKLWPRIGLAKKYKWDVGIEIPAIPGKKRQTKKLVGYFKDKVDFINLNELEIADNKMSKLSRLGFTTKNKLSYAVKGSEKIGRELLKYGKNMHYCTAKLKDKIQMGNRIKKRARKARKEYDLITKEGMLIRGVIYGKNLSKLRKELMKEFKIPASLIEVEDGRILTGAWITNELQKELKKKKLKISIVEEYPTWDKFPISETYI